MFGFIARTLGLMTGGSQALISGRAGQAVDLRGLIAGCFSGQGVNLASSSFPARDGHAAAFAASNNNNPQPARQQQPQTPAHA